MRRESLARAANFEIAMPFSRVQVGEFITVRTTANKKLVVRKIAPVPKGVVADNSHDYELIGQVEEPEEYNVIHLAGKFNFHDYFCLPDELVVGYLPGYM